MTDRKPETDRPHHLNWNGTEWVDSRCGCRYHPDDDNGSHGGAPHVHPCEKHTPAPESDRGDNEELFHQLAQENPDAILLDGYEGALVGLGRRCGQETIAVYSRDQCIEVLVGHGLSHQDAEEYFSFNVEGAWSGPHTPLILAG